MFETFSLLVVDVPPFGRIGSGGGENVLSQAAN